MTQDTVKRNSLAQNPRKIGRPTADTAIRAALAARMPPDLLSGLARCGYRMVSWRLTDDMPPVKRYQFRRTSEPPHPNGMRTTPYEWTVDEAWQLLAEMEQRSEQNEMG